MLLLLSVQVGGGGDQAGVRVDAEELVAGAGQQTVPHHGVLLWRKHTAGSCMLTGSGVMLKRVRRCNVLVLLTQSLVDSECNSLWLRYLEDKMTHDVYTS